MNEIKKLQLKQNNRLFKVFLFFLVVLGLTQIYLSNRLADWGQELKEIQKQIALIEEENKLCKLELISVNRLTNLHVSAEEQGFVKNPQTVNLSLKIPVALNY